MKGHHQVALMMLKVEEVVDLPRPLRPMRERARVRGWIQGSGCAQ